MVDSGECVGGVSALGAGPRDWCRALSSWVTSLGDSGLLWGTDGGDSRIAPRIEYGAGSTSLVSGVGLGLVTGDCLGHLPSPLSSRILDALMRSRVVEFCRTP